MSEKKDTAVYTDTGTTSFYKNVINNIIRLSCMQVSGVAGLTKGNSSGMRKFSTRKYEDGVLVYTESGGLFIDVYISVYYGTKVPEIAYKIQHAIKESVETATEHKVARVNVHVTGVVVREEDKKKPEEIPKYGLEEKN